MSDAAPAKKAGKPKKPADHPPVAQIIIINNKLENFIALFPCAQKRFTFCEYLYNSPITLCEYIYNSQMQKWSLWECISVENLCVLTLERNHTGEKPCNVLLSHAPFNEFLIEFDPNNTKRCRIGLGLPHLSPKIIRRDMSTPSPVNIMWKDLSHNSHWSALIWSSPKSNILKWPFTGIMYEPNHMIISCNVVANIYTLIHTPSLGYGHTTLNTPVLVRSPKLSNVGPG